jgi:hypothetical protein
VADNASTVALLQNHAATTAARRPAPADAGHPRIIYRGNQLRNGSCIFEKLIVMHPLKCAANGIRTLSSRSIFVARAGDGQADERVSQRSPKRTR